MKIISQLFIKYNYIKIPGGVYVWYDNQVRGWIKPPSGHPVADVNIRLCGDGYGAAGLRIPGGDEKSENTMWVNIVQAPYSGVADSGAQTTCAGMSLVRALG